ncbi:MAG: ABC transporter permease [Dehalococcoidia bacterium]|nr:ABC transporter permease [Dehalococcoidia bacterium]
MATQQQAIGVAKQKRVGIITKVRRAGLPWLAVIILFAIIFSAIFAPLLTPHSPYEVDLPSRLLPPTWQPGGSPEHFLGTDTLVRDLLTRIFYGARVSLIVALLVNVIAGGIGLALGIIAGYTKGTFSAIIMRVVDSFMAIPNILLALVFAMTLGPSMRTVIVALSVLLWARFARLIRGDTLSVTKRDFILQARVAGCSTPRIMAIHIFPNVFNTFMVMASLELGQVILAEASLSFLGAGIPPPTPSWGQMVSEGRGYITSAWWISFFPGLTLALTVLAFNMFGDWLRDKLDPRLRQL